MAVFTLEADYPSETDYPFLVLTNFPQVIQARSRGRGRGRAQAPPEIFRLESLLQKWNFCTKVDSCQWNLKFQSIVDHSKIMYCCSSVQFGIV